jgi:hypothetical protein
MWHFLAVVKGQFLLGNLPSALPLRLREVDSEAPHRIWGSNMKIRGRGVLLVPWRHSLTTPSWGFQSSTQ